MCLNPLIGVLAESGALSPISTRRPHPYILWRTLGCRRPVPLDIVPSVCPHDCPSACALAVERLGGGRIGAGEGGGGAGLYPGCRLRQGRPLCRAPAPPGPPFPGAAPGRRERCRPRRLQADLV